MKNQTTSNASTAVTVQDIQLTVAANRKAFMDALFTGPRTFDAFIIRKTKNNIVLQFMDETYTLNRNHVFCLTTLHEGRKWYSYGGKLNNHPMRVREQFEEQVRAIAGQL